MILTLLACVQGGDFADTVVSAPGADPSQLYGDPALAVNGARGGGCCAGSADVYSLSLDGERPELIVRWSDRVVLDGPGDDLVVFENPFDVGTRGQRFMDLVVVGVSADGETFQDFPHRYEGGLTYSADPDMWVGFAGRTPTLLDDSADARAVDPEQGGDRFDLDALEQGPVRDDILVDGVRAIRLRPAGTQTNPDTQAPFPVDPVSDGPDIDAVYAWNFDQG